MAAAKKRKAKVKGKKAPASKPAARKKSAAPASKKAAPKRAALKKTAAKTQRSAAPAQKLAVRPAPPPVVPVRPAPLPGEERVGFVTHYFGHLSVAAVRLDSGSLRVGDTIRILGHTSDFRQRVESMQVEHQPVTEAGKRQEIGIKVTQHARENDDVYKVAA